MEVTRSVFESFCSFRDADNAADTSVRAHIPAQAIV